MRYRLIAATLTAFALPSVMQAQCPDGTPPPCRTGAVARRDPIDDRTWIVVPFTNTTRAPDVAWIGDASVSMLSIDMSRWTDYHVIDAERVTDLLQQVPVATRAPLGLQSAITLAKQVGAGRLVMGEYLREGVRTTVTARVFNVRTGQRVSVASEVASAPDSIAATYKRLAPKVLDVPPPIGTTLSGVGTSSAEALRAYVLGIQAASRWRHDSARVHFARAVQLDSTFALAQLRLAIDLRLAASGRATPEWRVAYAGAVKYSVDLPERERLLVALGASPLTQAVRCSSADRLLQLDSADAEGWVARGQCLQKDSLVIVAGDGSVRLASSYNSARMAFQRALELLPKREALIGLLNMVAFPEITTCAVAGPCPSNQLYTAPVILVADTFATPFARADPFHSQSRLATYAAGRRAMAMWGRDFAARWAAQHPLDYGGRIFYGEFAAILGDLTTARTQLNSVADWVAVASSYNRDVYYSFAAAVESKAGRFDSVAALVAMSRSADFVVPVIAFGMLDHAAMMRTATLRTRAAACDPLYLGVAVDFTKQIAECRAASTAASTVPDRIGVTAAFHTLRMRPAADTASASELIRFQAFLALRDTARARAELAKYDGWGATRAEDIFDGYEMFAAESYLELGDTATAWGRIEPFGRRWAHYDLRIEAVGCGGRAWLLYADLAAATGHTAEAKRGYSAVVDMWGRGDAIVQPMVTRARDALAKLR